jgi:hypothetical protein
MDNPKPDATTNVPRPESPELAAERQRKVTAEMMHEGDEPSTEEDDRKDQDEQP